MKEIVKLTLIASLLLLSSFHLSADDRKDFIRKYRHIAIREMERTGIPASITLAQGILESGCGKSELAVKANNHFGIKCHNWEGDTYTMDDDAKNECFRKYKNAEQSWIDHSEFLTSRPRYAGLFNLKSTDYKAWAKGLKAAGYATNPQYADLLIKIIEDEELHQYDRNIKHKVHHPQVPSISVEEFAESISSQFRPGNISYHNREEMRNGILCIEAVAGDSFEKIAKYYGIKLKKILQYNDKKDSSLKPGEMVYLKRKKTKAARGYEFHRVKAGDTLYGIAQQYGIRLKNLAGYNYLYPDSPLTEGEKIFLRKKADLL
ncbi:MAG: glucosaminidase domain-containing protein [Odoribacter sp.]|nr:glucosaminidase domain-containing protein [Odoribacter sp.]